MIFKNHRVFITLAILIIGIFTSNCYASRLKDVTKIEGVRDNQLIGYGLVVGLAGDGDKSSDFTDNALSSMLLEFGISVEEAKSKNIAAVIVTTDIEPFIKPGSRIDVTVSSLGDAKSLHGGVLLQTPLKGADGIVYAVAQGPVAVGGFLGGGGGGGGSASVQQNHPTVAKIASGAIVEREITTEIVDKGSINLLLANADFTSAVRLAEAVNRVYPGSSQALNAGAVNVYIPEKFKGQEVNFIAAIGGIEVIPDVTARVIVNERTGTIVATSNVRISTVAVSHGSLTITISNTEEVSQPAPSTKVEIDDSGPLSGPTSFSEGGRTVVTNNQQVNVTEVRGGFSVVDDFPTIERLTTALNALGVSTREMMSILQAIKSAGALQAELILK